MSTLAGSVSSRRSNSTTFAGMWELTQTLASPGPCASSGLPDQGHSSGILVLLVGLFGDLLLGQFQDGLGGRRLRLDERFGQLPLAGTRLDLLAHPTRSRVARVTKPADRR